MGYSYADVIALFMCDGLDDFAQAILTDLGSDYNYSVAYA